MKRVVFLAILLTAVTATGQDWAGDLQTEGGSVHAMAGLTWDSKYIWRGFDVYDGKSAAHLSVDLNLFETGFGASAVGHRALAAGFEDRERWDGTLYYQGGLFAGAPLATNFRAGFVYYMYPELNEGESLDMQEGHLILSWPNLLPIQGLQPSYLLIKMWPSHSGSPLPNSASGWMHIGMLDYGFSIPGLIPGIAEHVIMLHGELVYNDGLTITPARPRNDWTVVYRNPDQDFSHYVLGISTDLAFGPDGSFIFTPAAYYQNTLNNSINEDDDEIWVSLAVKYAF
jgi:hypothetical protein